MYCLVISVTMARSSYSSNPLTTPPPIVGMEVSARWKRTWKGEVIMMIVMPENVIDTEVYVKTSKEHIGLQMDPWMSCSWKRTWSSTHPLTSRPRKRSGNLDYRRLVEELVSSGQLADPGRDGTATGHPDQKPDVTPITLTGHHSQPNKLFRIPGHHHLPKPR